MAISVSPSTTKNRHWEDHTGTVHYVSPSPYSHSARVYRYTQCNLTVELRPGRWTDWKVTCLECCTNMKMTLADPLPAEHRAAQWKFQTSLHSKGPIVHGVPVREKWRYTVYEVLDTFCGVKTDLKLQKNTGRWLYNDATITCLSCLAAMVNT